MLARHFVLRRSEKGKENGAIQTHHMRRSFPRYTEYEPRVPVWCVTPGEGRAIHRFFDTSPFSPSGQYLAVFRLPYEDRLPSPGDRGQVCLVDLQTGKDRVVAETAGWETQLGANLNWGADDHTLFFNDVDTDTWTPFAWRLDPLSGRRGRMAGTVYHASADGRWLVSANLAALRKTQPGYGVWVPDDRLPRNSGPTEDGFTLTDTATGRARPLVSIRDLLTKPDPAVEEPDPDAFEFYGFHSKFNPQGDRLMVSLRWYPVQEPDFWNMFGQRHGSVRFAWVTLGLDGSRMHCAVGPEQWAKRGHHATWFPDGRRISMNLNIDGDGLRFVQVNEDGSALRKMRDDVWGSGHPTVAPDGRHLLTDTYTREKTAYGDGTIPLRWVDIRTGEEEVLVRINTAQPAGESCLRVDPHPAWDRTGRYVAFNGFVGGTRRVFVADLGDRLQTS